MIDLTRSSSDEDHGNGVGVLSSNTSNLVLSGDISDAGNAAAAAAAVLPPPMFTPKSKRQGVSFHSRDQMWQASLKTAEGKQITRSASSKRAAIIKYNALVREHTPERAAELLHDLTHYGEESDGHNVSEALPATPHHAATAHAVSALQAVVHAASSSSSSPASAIAVVPQQFNYTAQCGPTHFRRHGQWLPVECGAKCSCGCGATIPPGAPRIKERDPAREFPNFYFPTCFFGADTDPHFAQSPLLRLALTLTAFPHFFSAAKQRARKHYNVTKLSFNKMAKGDALKIRAMQDRHQAAMRQKLIAKRQQNMKRKPTPKPKRSSAKRTTTLIAKHKQKMKRKTMPKPQRSSAKRATKRRRTAAPRPPVQSSPELRALDTLIETIEVDLSQLITRRTEYQRIHDAGDSSLDGLLEYLTPHIKATRDVLTLRKAARRSLWEEME